MDRTITLRVDDRNDISVEYITPWVHFRPDFYIQIPYKFNRVVDNREHFRILTGIVKELKRVSKLLMPDVFLGGIQSAYALAENKPVTLFSLVVNFFTTSLTVSRSRTEQGNAVINLSFPNFQEPFFDALKNIFDQVFSPFIPVRIYMRGRFVNRLFPVFTGFVTNVSYSERTNFKTITLSCSDNLKLLAVNPININPAVAERRIFEAAIENEEIRVRAYSNPLTNLTVEQILKMLILGTKAVNIDEIGRVYIDGISNITEVRRDVLGGLEGSYEQNEAREVESREDAISQTMTFIPGAVMSPQLFIYTRKTIVPYKYLDVSQAPLFQSDMVTRLEVIRDVADRTFHEFFADEVGDFYFMPMRLSIPFIQYDFFDFDRGVFGKSPHKNDVPAMVYMIMDDELLNADFSVNDSEIVTAVDVYGEFPFSEGSELGFVEWAMRGFAEDRRLIQRFGLRWQRVKMSLLNNLSLLIDMRASMLMDKLRKLEAETKEAKGAEKKEKEKELARLRTQAEKTFEEVRRSANDMQALLDLLAEVYMRFLNSRAYTCSASIILRPELSVAKPVIFPERNEIFYIDSLTHTINVGGDATTMLSLSCGRKIDERVDFVDVLLSLHDPGTISTYLEDFMRKYKGG